MPPALNLSPALDALPTASRLRLYVMGWPGHAPSLQQPDRALRRAIGAPQPVGMVDLELDPERWHGSYIVTYGTVGWTRDTTNLGRLWLNPALCLFGGGLVTAAPRAALPTQFAARITGILLADPQVRAAHRSRHSSPGGYGHFGLFIAELLAASIHVEPDPRAEPGVAPLGGRDLSGPQSRRPQSARRLAPAVTPIPTLPPGAPRGPGPNDPKG